MKRLISIVLAMTMLLYGLTAFAGGDGAYDSILSKGELVIGLDDSCPPLSSGDGSGEAVGFNADVAREICSRMGVEPVIKLMPLDDMLMDIIYMIIGGNSEIQIAVKDKHSQLDEIGVIFT